MATAPQINKSASLQDKQKHIVKHAGSVPMLNMLIKNQILKVADLDDDAVNEMLIANDWLCLDELGVDEIIIDKMGTKVDPKTRLSEEIKTTLASNGLQATQGLMQMTFSCTLVFHRNHDSDALAQEITDFVSSKCAYTINHS